MRDRAAALARALTRQSQLDALRRAGRMEIEVAGPGGGARRLVLSSGRLADEDPGQLSLLGGDSEDDDLDPSLPLPRHLVDELTCVASWLEAEARSVRVLHCEGPWSLPVPRLPKFEPVKVRSRSPA